VFPETLKASTWAYIHILDTELPGLVTGVYAVGSVALSDHCERTSNLDLIVVSDDTLPAAALGAAVRAQKALDRHHGRSATVAYASTADLAKDPRNLDLPCFEGNHRVPSERLVNPMTWQLLATHPIALRGSAHPRCSCDTDSVKAWAAEQLQTVWRPKLSHPSRHMSLWFRRNVSATALELSRLSITAATGTVTSKTEAASAIRTRVPARFRRCLDDAVGYRSGGPMSMSMYWGGLERKHDLTALLREVVSVTPGSPPVESDESARP
jgi:hypothetical protein